MMPGLTRKIFLLSPAQAGGARARLLLNPRAAFPLARRFQTEGLPLADVFAFASGLYFRGKIAYARRFAGPDDAIRIITSNRGLMDPAWLIRPENLIGFGQTEIEPKDAAFFRPLFRDALQLAREFGAGARIILLGSIATPKYREILLEVFGGQLLFPDSFVGRGDMSRGALLLQAAAAGIELEYSTVRGTSLTGKRANRVGTANHRRSKVTVD